MNKKNENETKKKSLLLNNETKTLAVSLKRSVNDKELGSTVSFNDIIKYALSKIAEEDIKTLQRASYTHKDIKRMYYLRYLEKVGPISEDDFEGYSMSNEFQKFKKENKDIELVM